MPYFAAEQVSLYLGDCREVLPALDVTADLMLADPPYGETSNKWDRWPDGWIEVAASVAASMWCFGSQRMFFDHLNEFTGWKLSQDIVWEKHNGTGFATDRFKRVHENILHWYRGQWSDQYQDVPRVAYIGPDKHSRARDSLTPHTGKIGPHVYEDDGTRLMRSVIKVKSVRGQDRHPDEKPIGVLDPLISYGCPRGGLVIDPFAGSGSTLDAARQSGRRAIGIEANEAYAEKAARRLEQLTLEAS